MTLTLWANIDVSLSHTNEIAVAQDLVTREYQKRVSASFVHRC
jgi:hypothetical protein